MTLRPVKGNLYQATLSFGGSMAPVISATASDIE
jgi:hypothetical protein